MVYSGGGNIIAGDYLNYYIEVENGIPYLITPDLKRAIAVLDSSNVVSIDVVDQDTRRSATSAVGRAAIGGALLGPIGLAAGLSAKKKGIYTISITYRTGERSLAEVNERGYRALLTANY